MAQVVLAKCREISPKNSDDSQVMFVRVDEGLNSAMPTRHSIYSISEANGTILFTENELNLGKCLHAVSFKDPVLYQHSSCHLSQFSISHAMVRNPHSLPFFLTGQEVEVECDQGYGVRRFNYSTLQTLVCSEDTRPRPCTRITPRKSCRGKNKNKAGEEGREKLHYLFLVLAIVSTIIAVVLLVVLMMTKRKIEHADTDE